MGYLQPHGLINLPPPIERWRGRKPSQGIYRHTQEVLMNKPVKQTALFLMFFKRLWWLSYMRRPGLLKQVAQLESAFAIQKVL